MRARVLPTPLPKIVQTDCAKHAHPGSKHSQIIANESPSAWVI